MSFLDKLKSKWEKQKFVCIGLDKGDFEFDKSIINQTADLVCAYKPNLAFYQEAQLQKTISYIKDTHPDIPIILDAKRGDIGNTSEAYAKSAFDDLGADAITVHPYLGKEAVQPFLDRKDKGVIVLVRTSNPGAGEFQDLIAGDKPLYLVVAEHVKTWGENVGVVVGATYPEELKKVREIIGDMPILIPGVGAQGGDISSLKNGLNSQGTGIIVSSSRGIIFAPSPREATLKLHHEISEALK